jgi:hypothetical protein
MVSAGKNIDTALILLCLAIGAICEAPAPLPGPIMDKKIDYLKVSAEQEYAD